MLLPVSGALSISLWGSGFWGSEACPLQGADWASHHSGCCGCLQHFQSTGELYSFYQSYQEICRRHFTISKAWLLQLSFVNFLCAICGINIFIVVFFFHYLAISCICSNFMISNFFFFFTNAQLFFPFLAQPQSKCGFCFTCATELWKLCNNDVYLLNTISWPSSVSLKHLTLIINMQTQRPMSTL